MKMSSLFSIGEDEMDLDDEVSRKTATLDYLNLTLIITININFNSFTIKYME